MLCLLHPDVSLSWVIAAICGSCASQRTAAPNGTVCYIFVDAGMMYFILWTAQIEFSVTAEEIKVQDRS